MLSSHDVRMVSLGLKMIWTQANITAFCLAEGVMVYNHLKNKVKSFLQPFAESGQAVGADDIKAYFEKLRGDEQGIKAAAVSSGDGGGEGGGDNRREQSGKRIVPTIIVRASADHGTSRLLDLDWMTRQRPEHVKGCKFDMAALGIGT